MSKLRAFTWNGGKIIDLLVYQKEHRKEESLSTEKKLRQEIHEKQAGWRYQERLRGQIPRIHKSRVCCHGGPFSCVFGERKI